MFFLKLKNYFDSVILPENIFFTDFLYHNIKILKLNELFTFRNQKFNYVQMIQSWLHLLLSLITTSFQEIILT
jgi:hypothetical protein